MKTVTTKIYIIVSLVAFLLVTMPVSVFAAGQDMTLDQQDNINHAILAQYHKQQANEYKDKIADVIQAVKSRPSTASFGRNAKTFKQHIEFKLRKFEVAVEENLQKAAYHEHMAVEESYRYSFAKSGKVNINPAP
ncbi:MAG: hypothetical protein H6937_02055 [Burkholderiales bacterium]|nr:hypothetical protein [Burkholderiales bacterium]MDR4517939.1 hypothetical protein [Nitrosomonas sp.]